MHRALERQIKKYLKDQSLLSNKELQGFLNAINITYNNFDEDRQLVDRSLEISSREFRELTNNLSQSKKDLEIKVSDLEKTRKAVINLLEDIDIEKKMVEQKVLERTKELSLEKNKLESVLSSIGEGVLAVDKDYVTFLYNKKAEEILGYSIDEVINKKPSDVLRIEGEEPGAAILPENRPLGLALKGQVSVKSFYGISKSGARVPVSVVASPILNEGEIIGAIVVFRDTTKERQAEQAKTDFLAIASHEMRTPLTIIKGKAERLIKKANFSDDTKSKDEVISIKNNSDRLLNIVNDFLDVVMLEEQRISLSKVSVDIKKIINEVVNELNIKVTEKGINLNFEDDQSVDANILGDPMRLKQVILNLTNNAISYTSKGSVIIKIFNNDDFIKLSVVDTGIGIPEDKQKTLFKKFSTVSGSFMHSRDYGSGLGLYICSLLLGAMGGRIELEKSTPNEGSIFSIYLKRK